MKKLFAIIIVSMILINVVLLSPEVAGADEYLVLTSSDYILEAGTFEGEPALLIVYKWQGQYHSFAWDKLWIEPWRPIWIRLTENGHCYDAGYCAETKPIEELP